jgi:hypothetical protein
MFFEATYVPSPPLSATSLGKIAKKTRMTNIRLTFSWEKDNDIPNGQLEENSTVLNENYSGFEDIEPTSDKPVDHLIFVIHVSYLFYVISKHITNTSNRVLDR